MIQEILDKIEKTKKENVSKQRRATATSVLSTLLREDRSSHFASAKKRCSKWEVLMRKFSDDCKANDPSRACNNMVKHTKPVLQPARTFRTGSKYYGTWDLFGMSGQGIYTYPDGTVYEGEFEDNMFHGQGVMRYRNGVKIHGLWVEGVLQETNIVCPDGVVYEEKDWEYCKPTDRRYAIEYSLGIQPAGRTFPTAEVPAPEVPEGYFDVGDGFYEPKTNTVFHYKDLTHVNRVPLTSAREWIFKHCRTSKHLQPIGPQPHLYEEWVQPKLQTETSSDLDPPVILKPTCSEHFFGSDYDDK